ncbi:hypothetical protein F4604DRAFT_1916574 [Suillus subluteus]|nr:hypothetical protein F4604DRAFT_1916574 [Suillus subluteus]
MVAIHGVHWKENDQMTVLLEEIIDSPRPVTGSTSHVEEEIMDVEIKAESSASDDEANSDSNGMTRDYSIELRLSPSIDEARHAYMDLRALLKPPCSDGVGYKDPPKLNTVLKERLEQMQDFLWLYTNITESDSRPHPANPVGRHWMRAADQAARNTGKAHGTYLSRCLQSWSKAYIKDHNAFPIHRQPQKFSCIYDESLTADLKLHLQSVGKYVRAQDLIDYLNVPENQAHHGFTKTISPRTAQ